MATVQFKKVNLVGSCIDVWLVFLSMPGLRGGGDAGGEQLLLLLPTSDSLADLDCSSVEEDRRSPGFSFIKSGFAS